LKQASLIMIGLSLLMFSVLAPQVKAFGITAYPWSMFHHDSMHTGFSLSPAPNVNSILWTFQTAGGIVGSPAVVDGKVFVGTENSLYAVDQINGKLLWSRQDIGSWWSSPAVDDGKVFICDFSNIYALKESDGSTVWSYPLDFFAYYSSPTVVGNLVFVGDIDGIYALNEKTGAKVWNYALPDVFCSVAAANGMIFAANLGPPCSLVALNMYTGHVVWSLSLDYGGSFVASPAVADGRVFVSVLTGDLANGCVLALNQFNGHIIWRSMETGPIYSSPAVAYDKVFVGSDDNNTYAFHEKDGSLIWSYATGNIIEASSPAVADNKVFIGSWDNYVYALDQHTGTLLWRLKTGGATGSPAIADGVLYAGSLDGRLYAVGTHAHKRF